MSHVITIIVIIVITIESERRRLQRAGLVRMGYSKYGKQYDLSYGSVIHNASIIVSTRPDAAFRKSGSDVRLYEG